MKEHLISINDLPPDGKEYMLDDQDIWLEPLQEFKMDCRIITPLKGKVFVQRADEGVIIRGSLKGVVVVPCARCTEDATVDIDTSFDEYEEIPAEGGHSKDEEHEGYVTWRNHAPMLNLAEIGWEQFMLAQPVTPLCMESCKGLCPDCGINLNMGECRCKKEHGDPRMAPLANATVKKN